MHIIILFSTFLASSVMLFYLIPLYLNCRENRQIEIQQISDYDLVRSRSLLGRIKPFLHQVSLLADKNNILRKWIKSSSPQFRHQLLKAGFPGNLEGGDFCALKLFAPLLFLFLLFFVFHLPLSVIYLFAAFMGFYLPDVWLKNKINFRRIEIEKILPDALDTFTLIVGAGINFNEALDIYIKETKPNALRDEFVIIRDEMRLGRSLTDSLKNMTKRSESAAVEHFVTMLLQSQHTGVPLSDVLSAQADDVRSRRFYLAEEMGNKAPVKMIFPLLLFIMPNVFVILFAPMIIQFYYKI